MWQLTMYLLYFLFFVFLVCTHCTQDPFLPHKRSTDKTQTPKQCSCIAKQLQSIAKQCIAVSHHHIGALTNTVCLNIITNYKSYIIAYTYSQHMFETVL